MRTALQCWFASCFMLVITLKGASHFMMQPNLNSRKYSQRHKLFSRGSNAYISIAFLEIGNAAIYAFSISRHVGHDDMRQSCCANQSHCHMLVFRCFCFDTQCRSYCSYHRWTFCERECRLLCPTYCAISGTLPVDQYSYARLMVTLVASTTECSASSYRRLVLTFPSHCLKLKMQLCE